ncbi:hypothetical protein P389DRAFT_166651 [Cystobasidium minutum MCA 4210]|uniref:uncharacterized protein n=1 Tax=Cystobasidium minutum MCA 4210 TaxID=1397322 RepID=UPI0034CD1106|eukprot:jgi/Rhomi1/166651/fgenesh1_kg.2_\
MIYPSTISYSILLSTSLLASVTTAVPTVSKRAPTTGPISVLRVHQHESDCAKIKNALQCDWAYQDFGRRNESSPPCSGLLSSALGFGCGTCLKVTCSGPTGDKSTYVRHIDQSGGAFDISYTNYLEIAPTEADYAQANKMIEVVEGPILSRAALTR